jgi:TRAP-type C4-dicarboxylate transport system substrate-binding protein
VGTHRPRRRTVAARTALLSVAVAVVGGCGGSGADKAGGGVEGKAVVLTLANVDPDPTNIDSPDFVAAVERLSGRSLGIEVRFGWGSGMTGEAAEEQAVADVRDGTVDLAIVPVRALDRLGVASVRALLAPFLVDSLALQQQVLTSPLAERLLEGVASLGVVGIAILPGESRHPLGTDGPLLAPGDYRGATVGARSSPVAEATFRALGASSRPYTPGSLSGLDGAELGAVTIGTNRYEEQARAVTTNVVFWPRAMAIVMNRRAYDTLSERRRELLRRAGKRAVRALVAATAHETETWLAKACSRPGFTLVRASAQDRAALRAAVVPVYDLLERDVQTRELIAAIGRLRDARPATASPGVLRCAARPMPASGGARTLHGRWEATLTSEELRRSGASPGLATALQGSWSVAFDGARFEFRRVEGGGGTGTYTVDGSSIRFVWAHGLEIRSGEVFVSGWSVYRDQLRFRPVEGRVKLAGLDVEPWVRAS